MRPEASYARIAGFLLMLLCCVPAAHAIVAPPTTPADFVGEWTGTNWSMGTVGVFSWLNCSAVAISPYEFMTARHLGSFVGEQYTISGVTYTVTSVLTPPNDAGQGLPPDLNLVKVDKPLPVAKWETVYHGNYDANPTVIMIGYGYSGLTYPDFYTMDTTTPAIKRWGTSKVFMPMENHSQDFSDTHGFAMLYNAADTTYEAGYATLDSGGGAFVKVGDRWQVAGINTNVSSKYGENMYTTNYAADLSSYYNWIMDNATLPGDANLDMKVSFSDYLVLEQHFGKTATGGWYDGDFNHDGQISFSDYLLLEQNFAKNVIPPSAGMADLPPVTGGTDPNQVPEPATTLLLIVGGAALLRNARPRRKA